MQRLTGRRLSRATRARLTKAAASANRRHAPEAPGIGRCRCMWKCWTSLQP